jgi:hypothetical protein
VIKKGSGLLGWAMAAVAPKAVPAARNCRRFKVIVSPFKNPPGHGVARIYSQKKALETDNRGEGESFFIRHIDR